MLNIGWFSTGRGPGSRQLLEVVYKYIQSGEIDGKINFVFCNREPHENKETDIFFDQIREYNIPLVTFSSEKFKDELRSSTGTVPPIEQRRIPYDREVMKRLKEYSPDICVLAGYMLIVGDEMCEAYKMINLHPALPDGPKGTWQEVIWNLIENKTEKSGIMIHLATPDLDRGPVITYCTYPITGDKFAPYWKEIEGSSIDTVKEEQGENNSLFQLIRKHGLSRELPLIVATLKALSKNEVCIDSGNIFNKQGEQIKGYNLSSEINRMVDI